MKIYWFGMARSLKSGPYTNLKETREKAKKSACGSRNNAIGIWSQEVKGWPEALEASRGQCKAPFVHIEWWGAHDVPHRLPDDFEGGGYSPQRYGESDA